MASPSLTLPTTSENLCVHSPTLLRRLVAGAWLVLVLIAVPLFVCMPLTSDVVLYDLQARNVLSGGVLYQDIFETNLPGMIWIHMLVRPAVGDSSVAIRIVDLAIVGSVILMLVSTLRRLGASSTVRLTVGFAISLFYLSTNEWCHCQRDVWMMLPVLGATLWRASWLGRQRTFVSSCLEGAVWGVAFWIKPFTVVPGLFCILAAWWFVRSNRHAMLKDAAGVISGGAIAGLIGVAWLVHNGAWPFFWETMTEWNSEYVASGKSRWTLARLTGMVQRFHPWFLVHLMAVPVAAHDVLRRRDAAASGRRCLLAGVYLGWLLQSFAFQHLMDYIHVPAVILAIAVLAVHEWSLPPAGMRACVAAALLIAALAAPLLRPARVANWNRCVTEGSTPEVRTALGSFPFPRFEDMERVIGFLQQQDLKPGSVTCYNVHSIHIYDRLGIKPSTRYLSLASLIGLFPAHEADFAEALRSSGQRFVVTEVQESARTRPSRKAVPAPGECVFPWSYPVVFRSGSYLVHEVDRPFDRVTGALSVSVEQRLADSAL